MKRSLESSVKQVQVRIVKLKKQKKYQFAILRLVIVVVFASRIYLGIFLKFPKKKYHPISLSVGGIRKDTLKMGFRTRCEIIFTRSTLVVSERGYPIKDRELSITKREIRGFS